MGRGRQKAKQAKVARELKYNSGSTDFEALQAELAGSRPANHDEGAPDEVDGDYSAWIDEEDDEDEDESR